MTASSDGCNSPSGSARSGARGTRGDISRLVPGGSPWSDHHSGSMWRLLVIGVAAAQRGGASSITAAWAPVPLPLRYFRSSRSLLLAKPRKKLPERSVTVHCASCNAKLYKYKKGAKTYLLSPSPSPSLPLPLLRFRRRRRDHRHHRPITPITPSRRQGQFSKVL